jgi:hypothetical protein
MAASKARGIDRRIISDYAKSGKLYENKLKGIAYYIILR